MLPPVISLINERFRHGRPSNDLSKAGVLVHMFDHTEDSLQKWRGCPNHQTVVEGHKPGDVGNGDCLATGNRFSSSLIWKGHSPVFGGGGGIIFRPEHVRVICGYGGDGGSRHGEDDGCGTNWCPPSEVDDPHGWCDGRPYRPTNLVDMLQAWSARSTTYNELIVDVATYEASLPYSIEAVIFDSTVHRQIILYYQAQGISISEVDLPLVFFDTNNEETPFSTIPNELLRVPW